MANVAIITPTLKAIGGTEIYLRQLIDIQLSRGDSVTAFTQDTALDYESPISIQPCGQVLTESLDPLRMLARADKISELANQLVDGFDRVEFHRLAPVDLLRGLSKRIPTLVFVHTAELTCPTGGRHLRASDACCNSRAGLNCFRSNVSQQCLSEPDGTPFPVKQRLRVFSRVPLSRQVSRLATCMVFNSQANKTLFARTVEQPQMARILQPTMPEISTEHEARDRNKLLYVGRLERSKGVLEAVRISATLDTSILHVIGNGSAENDARRLARELSANVKFHGWLGHSGIASHLRTAGCLLLPSIGFEAWGMVGPEAIAAGCPVVAYDNGGVSEWLKPNCGQLVPAGDTLAFVDAVRQRSGKPIPVSESTKLYSAFGQEAFANHYDQVLKDTSGRFSTRDQPVVMHVQRQPLPGYQSIEMLFESIRSGMPEDINIQIREMPYASKGVWRRVLNLLAMRKLKADVFHITGDVHYLGLALPSDKTIQTVHDAVFNTRTHGIRRWLIKKLYYDIPLKRGTINTTISKATRSDVAQLIGLSSDEFKVIPNCVPPEFCFSAKPFNKTCPEVLLIGTLSHKNQERVISALTGQELSLHIIGSLDTALKNTLIASGLKYRNNVDLSKEQILQAYIDCDILVFASTFEGFGMPVIEAQSIGRAVVTSNVSSLPEVAGEGAILVNPESSIEIVGAVNRIRSDDVFRQRLIESGRENAAKYTAKSVAAEYVKLYQQVIEGSKQLKEVRE